MAGWGDDPQLDELRGLIDEGWAPVKTTVGSGSDPVDRVWVEKDGETREFASDHIAFHRYVEGLREDDPRLAT